MPMQINRFKEINQWKEWKDIIREKGLNHPEFNPIEDEILKQRTIDLISYLIIASLLS
jgi:hypothetical protein